MVASALLHDWAITSYGHLVEEALQYAGAGFDHELRLLEIMSNETPEEIGGIERQLLVGRGTGLREWADRVSTAAEGAEQLIAEITDHIRGHGLLGRIIAGDIDIDNIDSVFRLSFHLGLLADTEAPARLAKAIVGIDREARAPVFDPTADTDIRLWQQSRRSLYQRLMLAPRDFAGKVMVLYATILALENGEISKVDWAMTDFEFLTRLLASHSREVRESAERWVAGELWELTPLRWMEGARPDYAKVRAFSRDLTIALHRTCLAYAIKDKRERRLMVRFAGGRSEVYGADPAKWLLGVGSPLRKPFTAIETTAVFQIAQDYFGTRLVEPETVTSAADHDTDAWLF